MNEFLKPPPINPGFAALYEEHGLNHVVPVGNLSVKLIEVQNGLQVEYGVGVPETIAFCKFLKDAGIEPPDRVQLVAHRYGVFFPESVV